MCRALRSVPGGIVGLGDLVTEHGDAVEADLQRYYGIDLSSVVTGEVSARRARALIAHLPPDSATATVTSGGGWTLTDHFLAAIHDRLAAANWQRGGGKGPRPKPIPRPSADDDSKHLGTAVSIAEFRSIVDSISTAEEADGRMSTDD